MRKFLVRAVAPAAVGLAMLLPAAPASAFTAAPKAAASPADGGLTQVQYRRGWHGHRGGWHGGRHWHGHRHRGIGPGVALGLATGAIIGGAIAAQQAPVYGGAPAYGGDADAYCASRFRSYDPASGTYLGYDGIRHSCP